MDYEEFNHKEKPTRLKLLNLYDMRKFGLDITKKLLKKHGFTDFEVNWALANENESIEENKLKIPKEIKEELEHFKKTGIPRCQVCGCKKPMVNAYDSKLKKINKHIWKTTCGHNKNLRLCIG